MCVCVCLCVVVVVVVFVFTYNKVYFNTAHFDANRSSCYRRERIKTTKGFQICILLPGIWRSEGVNNNTTINLVIHIHLTSDLF